MRRPTVLQKRNPNSLPDREACREIFTAAAKQQRRRQFLGDISAARIDTPAEKCEVER